MHGVDAFYVVDEIDIAEGTIKIQCYIVKALRKWVFFILQTFVSAC